MGPQGNWSLCASPLGAPIQEILIIPPHFQSPMSQKQRGLVWRCLCYVPFTLKPNDGISTRGFVNSLPPKASSIRDRTVLELGPCSMPVTRGALRAPLQRHLGQGTEICYSGPVSLHLAAGQRWGGAGGFPVHPFWWCHSCILCVCVCASSCAAGPPWDPPRATTKGAHRPCAKAPPLSDAARAKSSAAAGRGARAGPSSRFPPSSSSPLWDRASPSVQR